MKKSGDSIDEMSSYGIDCDWRRWNHTGGSIHLNFLALSICHHLSDAGSAVQVHCNVNDSTMGEVSCRYLYSHLNYNWRVGF